MYSKLKYLRRSEIKATAVAIFGMSAIGVLWKRDAEEKNTENHAKDQGPETFSSQSNPSPKFSLLSHLKSNLQPPDHFQQQRERLCQCESFPIQPTITQEKRVALLSRKSTLRILDASSNPIRNLHAKYSVKWNIPLGEGAFGAVYLATNRRTGDKVALKKIPKVFTDDASFQNEVNALARVGMNGGHPHICSIKEIFEDEKYYHLVLDLVSGGEMFEHLIKLGAYSEADASRLVKEVADALNFLHGIEIVHGDLKPENLMLSTTRKEDSTIKLVDFGCALIRSEDGKSIISQSSAGNTPAYCPPEVLENTKVPISPSMDIWGLGIILYIMLTGLHPFDLDGKFPYTFVSYALLE